MNDNLLGKTWKNLHIVRVVQFFRISVTSIISMDWTRWYPKLNRKRHSDGIIRTLINRAHTSQVGRSGSWGTRWNLCKEFFIKRFCNSRTVPWNYRNLWKEEQRYLSHVKIRKQICKAFEEVKINEKVEF